MIFSPLEQFNAVKLFDFYCYGYDLSFFSTLVPLLLILVFFEIFRSFFIFEFKLLPDFWQFFLEILYKFIIDIVLQQTGRDGLVYFPFVFHLFIFILFCNFLSLVPFGIALTSHIIVIFFLSLTLWLSIFTIGLLRHNVFFLRLFLPEAPFLVLLLLMPIELASYAIRALSLALRLSANIMAGHILVYILSGFVLYMSSLSLWFIIFGLLLLLILLLELGVAFVQAYVFTVLFCVYLNDSLKVPGH